MTENEKIIVDLLEKSTKGIMAQIRAVLYLSIKALVLQGVPEEKAYKLYQQALAETQKEMGFIPIKEEVFGNVED